MSFLLTPARGRRPLAVCLGFVLAAPALVPTAAAETRQELLEMKNTVMNLVDALVEQGVLPAEQAETLKDKAKAQAAVDARKELLEEKANNARVVRVPYVPEFVRDEIKEEVRQGLKSDVLADVEKKAKDERWGTPDALPGWVNRFEWFGDFRVRYDFNRFDDENQPESVFNVQALNDSRGFLNQSDAFFNFTENRSRLRMRLRFGFETQIARGLATRVRLATSSSPVSRNVDMGNTFENFNLIVERAFMRYQNHYGDWGNLTLLAGKYEVPFDRTEMVWDNDINLTGLTAMYSNTFGAGTETGLAPGGDNTVRVAFGVYPIDLDEIPFDDGESNDKWMLGLQFEYERRLSAMATASVSAAVYDYRNTRGVFNPIAGDTTTEWSAPDFVQKGNSKYLISAINDPNSDPFVFGLATDYTLVNLIGDLRLNFFDPIVVDLTAAYVKNVGYDRQDIEDVAGLLINVDDDLDSRDEGYELSAYAGHPEVSGWGTWRVGGRYVYLQGDAVLDAATNSNFQLGGTNYSGWQADVWVGVTPDSFARLRYFSTNEITGVPLGIDVLLLDYQTNF